MVVCNSASTTTTTTTTTTNTTITTTTTIIANDKILVIYHWYNTSIACIYICTLQLDHQVASVCLGFLFLCLVQKDLYLHTRNPRLVCGE